MKNLTLVIVGLNVLEPQEAHDSGLQATPCEAGSSTKTPCEAEQIYYSYNNEKHLSLPCI